LPAEPADSEGAEIVDGISALGHAATPAEVAQLLGFTWRRLAWVLYGHGAEGYYNTWQITKRSGGTREIRAPRSQLWKAQHALHGLLQTGYKPRPSTHGFVRNRSVATNALPHVRKRFLLNVDIEDFFPSIHFGRVRGLFLAHPFNCAPNVATVLARVCCSDGKLPIGAPTSPVVANMICIRLDREMQRLARRCACWYTRYADDMTFSTNLTEFPSELAYREADDLHLGTELLRILRANSFEPNLAKSRLRSADQRQVVTGIVVNERPNLRRDYVREIRAMLHAWDKHGLAGAQEHFAERFESRRRDPAAKDRYPGANVQFRRALQGRIAYLSMVRGHGDWIVRRYSDQFDNLSGGKSRLAELDAEDYKPEPYQQPLEFASSGPRRLLTVMFTDIVESTALNATLGDNAWKSLERKHNRLIKSEVSRRYGHVVKWMGDGSMAIFEHPHYGIECAQRIVDRVKVLGVELRVGLHTGEVEWDGDDVHGLGVDISARVGAKAAASQVVVSSTVKELLEGGDHAFVRLGSFKLKGVPGKRTLYQLTF
jgi:RNA-directed DNA polymerase